MSNYVQSTNFATKDALSSGDPLKIVKGTEINIEYNNIATAIATKADLASPTFVTPNLGTPSAGVMTNVTGLPLTTGVTGLLPLANGGTGTATPSLVAGTNITVTGTFPNQTVSTGGVTSLIAGTGITVSSATGAVTVASTVANIPGIFGQVFTANGTYTIPAGVTACKVVVVGGGSSSFGTGGIATAGGTSSVSSGTQTITTISATGGPGGGGARVGGLGSGGDINSSGRGSNGTAENNFTITGPFGGNASAVAAGVFGNGPSGDFGGVAGGFATKYLTGLTPGNTLTITRGAGGADPGGGYAGGNGIIVIEN